MIDLTKPLRTKTGCTAEVVASDLSGVYSLAVVVTNAGGSKIIRQYTETGRWSLIHTSSEDLENVPDEVWIPVFGRDGLHLLSSRPSFSTKEKVFAVYRTAEDFTHAVKIK